MKKDFRVALVMPNYGRAEVPLGLAYITAVLENEGIPVEGIDLNVREINPNFYKNFDLIGISTSSPQLKAALKEAEKVKCVNPKAVVVLGGPHPSVMPEHTLSFKDVDMIVIGDGEYPMLDLAIALSEGSDFEGIAGLGYNKEGTLYINPPKKPPNLDLLPLPAKHIFNLEDYPSKFYAVREIIAGRGCPHQCTNCQPGLSKIAPYRCRSPEKVVDEMEYLKREYDISHFAFLDNTISVSKKFLLEMCDEIIGRRLKITWTSNSRTNELSKELLECMRDAGCITLAYGIESGSQRVIDELLNKKINLEEAKRVIAETRALGILTHAYFMVGIPGETKEDIQETINFAKSLRLSSQTVNILTPWPGTRFYEMVKENGWLVKDDFTEFTSTNSVIDTPYLSREDTNEAFHSFIKEFLKIGWRLSKDRISLYSPSYKKEVVSVGLRKILHQGLNKNDVKLIWSMIENRLI